MGTTLGWSSPVGPQILLTNQTLNITDNVWLLQLTDEEMSWVGSLLNIGGLLGSLSGGFLMNTFGARTVMMSLSVPFVIGWLIIALAINTRNFIFKVVIRRSKYSSILIHQRCCMSGGLYAD